MSAAVMRSRFKTRICRNDLVQVIAGRGTGKRILAPGEDVKNRGLRGKVLSVDRQAGRVVVQGVRTIYKHQRRSRDPSRPAGGRIERDGSIAISDVMLVCPSCDRPTRIGIRLEQHERQGGVTKVKRIRVCKRCGADIPERR
ncbi:MAG: 50S ribosomal protein L24, partial [Planctomycetota bacterium]|nr:50S ribosomal protein L24 [Planctomycetota bacterium]